MRATLTREFYIPRTFTECREFPEVNAIVYINTEAKPTAKGFSGKRAKPDFNFNFRSVDKMETHIAEWVASLQRRKEYKDQAKKERTGLMEPAHSAKVLKGLLQGFWPGVKFSVNSDIYSMGCSIGVRYTDGPLKVEVEAVTGLFQYGRFDGMTDCSSSVDVKVPGCGGAKYVHVSREKSAGLKAEIEAIMEVSFCPRDDWREGFAPYQWAEAEMMLHGIEKEVVEAANQERVAQVLGVEAEQATPSEVKPELIETCLREMQRLCPIEVKPETPGGNVIDFTTRLKAKQERQSMNG